MKDLITFTDKGFYCEEGGFYIDPVKAVNKALITHAHSDHARSGHKSYLSHTQSVPLLKFRLGNKINAQGIEWGKVLNINGVKVSFHPSGHMVGASQIRVEKNGQIWVLSGDYKVEDDGISGKFEPIKCTHLVSECTFGMPYYKWEPQNVIMNQINDWWKENQANSIASIILGYTFGKTQRILANIDNSIGQIFVHEITFNSNKAVEAAGVALPDYMMLNEDVPKDLVSKSLIIAPAQILRSPIINKLTPYSIAEASGWMIIDNFRNIGRVDKGFILSDHADWEGLKWAIKETEAEKIYLTHGYTKPFSKYLQSIGYDASEVYSQYIPTKKELLAKDQLSLPFYND